MSIQLAFSGSLHGKFAKVDTNLSLLQFEDSGSIVIYAPALEVYGYGKDLPEAKKSFETCLTEFVNYTLNKGTFKAEMKRLGWKIKSRRNVKNYTIPTLSELLVTNNDLKNIMNNKEVRSFKENIPMAIPV